VTVVGSNHSVAPKGEEISAMTSLKSIGAAAIAGVLLSAGYAAAETKLRFVGQFGPTDPKAPMEDALVKRLEANPKLDIKIDHLNRDVLKVKSADGFRLVKSQTFDLMSIQIGHASRDDAFFEGLDLIGVSTNMDDLRVAVNAYRDVFNERLAAKFGSKALALWPFGTQVFYCNHPIKNLGDLKGLKVRSFTPSMSELLKYLGATPVTLQFAEVYPALQRGVASCGVTSPTSGNGGKWPEVTTHQLPVSVAGSVQGHVINLKKWNEFSDAEKAILEEEFLKFEDQLWDAAISLNGDAINCNTGREPCGTKHAKFNMTLVEVSDADKAKVKEAVNAVVLPTWAKKCNSIYPECSKIWNETVGKARGFQIK
jgi:TRAP-type C4-dicarboxylate transport system substrate-binding protein